MKEFGIVVLTIILVYLIYYYLIKPKNAPVEKRSPSATTLNSTQTTTFNTNQPLNVLGRVASRQGYYRL